MYFVATSFDFEAAHFLRNYEGKCANMHGHNYKVEVTLKGEKLQVNGILIDFNLIKSIGKSLVHNLDHKVLNDVMEDNPTAENIARLIFDSFFVQIMNMGVVVDSVKVWETPNSYAIYRED